MPKFEKKNISSTIKDNSILLRFMENIFMLYSNSEEILNNFRNIIHWKHQPIKFDYNFSKVKLEFVDTLVYKDKNNRLQATLFKKLHQPFKRCQSTEEFYVCHQVNRESSYAIYILECAICKIQ